MEKNFFHNNVKHCGHCSHRLCRFLLYSQKSASLSLYGLKLQYFGDHCLFLGGVCVCIGLFWYPSETWCHRKNSRIHYLRTSGLWQEINSNWLKLKKILVSKLKIPVVATLIMTGSKSLNATSEPVSLHMSALLSSPLMLLLCVYGDWWKLSLTSSSLLAVLGGKWNKPPKKCLS